MSELDVPIGDPAFLGGDPDPALARLRLDDPVHWQEAERCWVVTGQRQVQTIGKDPGHFCSGLGVLLGDRERRVVAEDSILYLDPPRHARHRALVSRAFTPRRVAVLEPRITALVHELLDALDPRAPVDLVDALCAPLPLRVISELLGLPEGDWDAFRRWSDAIIEAATDLTEDNALVALELIEYFDAQLDARARQPTDDLLSALRAAEVDGQRLSRAEVLGFCMSLLVAGNETTRSLLSGGLAELARHPDQRAALAADRRLVPGAVEEMLRWVTPITGFARTVRGRVALGDTTLGDGDYVYMVYRAANRDEAVYGQSAGTFDVRRSPNPHVAFGFGEHFCIGAGLARLEGRVVLTELLGRFPDYEVVAEGPRVPSTLVNQVERLEVVLDPAGRPGRPGARVSRPAG